MIGSMKSHIKFDCIVNLANMKQKAVYFIAFLHTLRQVDSRHS